MEEARANRVREAHSSHIPISNSERAVRDALHGTAAPLQQNTVRSPDRLENYEYFRDFNDNPPTSSRIIIDRDAILNPTTLRELVFSVKNTHLPERINNLSQSCVINQRYLKK